MKRGNRGRRNSRRGLNRQKKLSRRLLKPKEKRKKETHRGGNSSRQVIVENDKCSGIKLANIDAVLGIER